MKLLFRKVRVQDPASPHHGQLVDLLVAEGKITEIGPELKLPADQVYAMEGARVSPGWIDITAQVGDPGYEQREDLSTAMAAAAAGGFTGIGCLPNTSPVVDSKAGIHYLRQASKRGVVELFPIGAVSRGCAGEDITEMIDMFEAGAVAFSDGEQSVQDGGLMLRALQYTTAFGGVVLNQPHNRSVALEGQMHEGVTSTSLGLRGLPALAETLMVQRDLGLLDYSGGRLHLANLSSAESIDLVRRAKAEGLPVTCSVAAHNLVFTDEDLATFDSALKVLPPLRSPQDREALIAGIADGTVDIISGNHVPREEEWKKLEFPFAAFGATGLQTAFALARTATADRVDLDRLIHCLTAGPRALFGLPPVRVAPGEAANLTFFDPDAEWTPQPEAMRSRSRNDPALGKVLRGRALGVFNRGLIEIYHA